MEASIFNKFRQIVYERSGIALGPNKESLVSARIGKRIRALDLADHAEYLHYVMEDRTGEEIVHLIDAISTNVTSFFREAEHFDFLARKVSEWLAGGQRRFRFWSAASSTGEEPYTMAMTLLETFGGADVDVRILATDISTRVLDRCRAGEYKPEKIQTVPTLLRDRYFDSERSGHETLYVAKPVLKRMITFSRLNLAEPPFPMQGPFDAVFCRNVMIYFDNTVRSNLLNEIYRIVKPRGFLFVGHAESLTGMMSSFRTVQPSVYIKE